MDAIAALAEVTLESAREPTADRIAETPVLDDVRGLRHADGLVALHRRLHALCRERGPLRAVLARIPWRLVIVRAWERIGYARLFSQTSFYTTSSIIEGPHGSVHGLVSITRTSIDSGTCGWPRVADGPILSSTPRGRARRTSSSTKTAPR